MQGTVSLTVLLAVFLSRSRLPASVGEGDRERVWRWLSLAAASSAEGSGVFFVAVLLNVVSITAPFPLTPVSASGRRHR